MDLENNEISSQSCTLKRKVHEKRWIWPGVFRLFSSEIVFLDRGGSHALGVPWTCPGAEYRRIFTVIELISEINKGHRDLAIPRWMKRFLLMSQEENILNWIYYYTLTRVWLANWQRSYVHMHWTTFLPGIDNACILGVPRYIIAFGLGAEGSVDAWWPYISNLRPWCIQLSFPAMYTSAGVNAETVLMYSHRESC